MVVSVLIASPSRGGCCVMLGDRELPPPDPAWLWDPDCLPAGAALGLSPERCDCHCEARGAPSILDPGFPGRFGNAVLNLFTCFEWALAAQSLAHGAICPAYCTCEGVEPLWEKGTYGNG